MTVASTFGKVLGNTGAYAKHAALASGLHSIEFVRATHEATATQYRIKDAVLAEKRAAVLTNRAAPVELPAIKRQRKVAV